MLMQETVGPVTSAMLYGSVEKSFFFVAIFIFSSIYLLKLQDIYTF